MNIAKITHSEIFFIKTLANSKHAMFKYFRLKRNSFAGKILERMYEHYCKNSISLHKEYKHFYKKEYSTYKEFLDRKYNLNSKEIQYLENKKLHYKNVKYETDSAISAFLKTDENVPKIAIFLGANLVEDSDED